MDPPHHPGSEIEDPPAGEASAQANAQAPAAQGDPQQEPSRRRRRGLAALWLFFGLGIAGSLALFLLGSGGTGQGQGGEAARGPARVMLGPRTKKKAQQEPAILPRCCSTEYGQPSEPSVAGAAVFGVGSPGHWGESMMPGLPTDGDVEAQLLRAAAADNSSSDGSGSSGGNSEALDGVAYLVVTGARDEAGYLEALLARLDGHFARLHPAYPLVVFAAAATPVSAEEEARLRAAAPHARLDLRRVGDLQLLASAAEGKNATGAAADAAAWAYARALWEFRVAAPRLLAGEHEWVLHLSEETLLDEDVVLDPFLALKVCWRTAAFWGPFVCLFGWF
jgi:hypothetical protein